MSILSRRNNRSLWIPDKANPKADYGCFVLPQASAENETQFIVIPTQEGSQRFRMKAFRI